MPVRSIVVAWFALLAAFAPSGVLHAGSGLHYALEVDLDPGAHQLSAEAIVHLPEAAPRTLRFALHPDLEVDTPTPGVRLEAAGDGKPAANLRVHTLHLPAGTRQVALRYRGTIHHPLVEASGDRARGVAETVGTIGRDGVFLSGASYWYPVFGDGPLTFSLQVRLPSGWEAVSQGERVLHARKTGGTRSRWEEKTAQTEIYLVAGPFKEYSRPFEIPSGRSVLAMAFLRAPDDDLAHTYLEATARHIRTFSELLGPYPYAKFALVENFWETGYGMPSFTLLGGTVIRLPFIIHSSYPHEILHNWWGNGVYVDYVRGNWAEGLTAYIADHGLQERRGTAADMRRDQLQRYADYVHSGRDLALVDFRARHSPASEAVGYGKALMLFHMLRRELGDEAFLAALREFYRAHLFRVADWDALRRTFARHADRNLDAFLAQWTTRTGAPRISIANARTRPLEDGNHELTLDVMQADDTPPWRLELPLAVTLEDQAQAHEVRVAIGKAQDTVRLRLPARPLRVDADAEFDVFRRVARREIPPTLSQAFGAERIVAVIPANAPADALAGYRALAAAWQDASGAAFEVVTDDAIDHLPADGSVWLLGWENRYLPALIAALDEASGVAPVRLAERRVELPGRLTGNADAVVLAARHPADDELALAWIAAGEPRMLPDLARRLPHYGRYSYLAFSGEGGENIASGQWPVTDSPLTIGVRQPDGTVSEVAAAPRPPRVPLLGRNM